MWPVIPGRRPTLLMLLRDLPIYLTGSACEKAEFTGGPRKETSGLGEGIRLTILIFQEELKVAFEGKR